MFIRIQKVRLTPVGSATYLPIIKMKEFWFCLLLTCLTGFPGTVLASSSFFSGLKSGSMSASSNMHSEQTLRSLSKKSLKFGFSDDEEDEEDEGSDPSSSPNGSAENIIEDNIAERLSEYMAFDHKKGKSATFSYYPQVNTDSDHDDGNLDFDQSYVTTNSVNWNYLFSGREEKTSSKEERPSLFGRVSTFFKKKSQEMSDRKARKILVKLRKQMKEEVREEEDKKPKLSKKKVRFPVARKLLDNYRALKTRLANERAQKTQRKSQLELEKHLASQHDRLTSDHWDAIDDLEEPLLLKKMKAEQVNNTLDDEYALGSDVIMGKGGFVESPLFVANQERIEALLKGQCQLSSSAESDEIIRWLLHACKNSDFFLSWKLEEGLDELILVFLEQSIDYYSSRLYKLHLEIDLKLGLMECFYDQLISGKFLKESFEDDFYATIRRYQTETRNFIILCLNAVHISEVLNSIVIIRNNS